MELEDNAKEPKKQTDPSRINLKMYKPSTVLSPHWYFNENFDVITQA